MENFYDKYAKLPEDVREAASSIETVNTIEHTAKKHNLHIDEAGIITDYVGKVLFGEIKPDKFVPNLAKALDIDDKTANAIAQDLNDQIFHPLRESLRKVNEEKIKEKEAEKYIPVTQAEQQESKEEILNQIENPPESKPKEKEKTLEVIKPTQLATPEDTPIKLDEETKEEAPPYVPKPKKEIPQPPKSVLQKKREDTFITPGEGSSHLERIAADPYKETIE
jgi:hypothetical protein